ncbi:hypothetical protein [Liquorilactobacillus vini]|uniref:hypothetical protein n=2 Tax=Liquorilactobacillus vini TaxID=238015 RepID=UPI0007050BAF|nr:hypothetical protein [Liquorilactobacillus vini]
MTLRITKKFQVNFNQQSCKAFFKKYPGQRKLIEQKVATALKHELATGMTKVKLALETKIAGQPCYEFRLNLGKIGPARIAFTVANRQAIVYYLSKNLQKSAFSHDLAKIVRG